MDIFDCGTTTDILVGALCPGSTCARENVSVGQGSSNRACALMGLPRSDLVQRFPFIESWEAS